MAVYVSSSFAEAILGPSSFESLFNNGSIEIRTGTQPATADSAATGTLIGRITRDGGTWSAGNPANGLNFIRDGRFAAKNPSHTWVLTGSATGTAGWFRLVANSADTGGASVTNHRIDGTIGTLQDEGDFQMRLPTLAINASFSININQWWYAIPPLGV